MRKILAILITAVVLLVSFAGCGGSSETTKEINDKSQAGNIITQDNQPNDININKDVSPLRDNAKYTFMVYMVGTDLESSEGPDGNLQGSMSKDLDEMMAVGSNNDLNIVVETGATKNWVNQKISNKENQRWLIKKGDIELVKSGIGNRNMGKPETLADFIVWTELAYPADKYVLDFEDHGGGVPGGFGVDELNDGDGLSMDEIQKALDAAYKATGKKLEIIGFDACLMATLETASISATYANYMVGSEETEPGHGWNYTAIAQAIVDNPSMAGDELGKAIVEGYKSQAIEWDDIDECTLSVTDLSKVAAIVEALNNFVSKAGADIEVSEQYYKFAEARSKSEDYGNAGGAHGGSTDMVDIVDLARNASSLYQSEAENLINKLKEAIVYKLPGCKSKPEANGLTVYLPCKDKEGMADKLEGYGKVDFSSTYKDFVKKYAAKLSQDTTPVAFEDKSPEEDSVSQRSKNTFLLASTGSKPIQVAAAAEDRFEVKIKEEDISQVDEIYSVLGRYDKNNSNKILFLGMDNDIDFDENTGIIRDNFSGTWVTLGGQFVSMFLEEQNDEFSQYLIPAKLNGEDVDIKVLYNYKTDSCEIEGGWKGIDEKSGMADKDIIKIKPGDKIIPMYYTYDFSTDMDGYEEGNEFTVGNELKLGIEDLPKETYLYGFYITDLAQNESYSDFVDIQVQ